MAPIFHANLRYFELYDDDNNIVDKWFGGGMDLTHFIFLKMIVFIFTVYAKKYVIINSTFYKTFKKNVMNIFGTIIITKLGVWEACLTIAEKTQL